MAEPRKSSLFDYLEIGSFLRDRLREGPRGLQARLAKAIGCQATYLIKVLKGSAHFSEDQGFRIAKFFEMGDRETEYCLDLIRQDRAADPESRIFLRGLIEKKSLAGQEVKSRVKGAPLEISLQSQIRYFSSIKPSLVHLGTSCHTLQTVDRISKWLKMEAIEVQKILDFLQGEGLVTYTDGSYRHASSMIHLSKDSPLHPNFQRLRRQMVLNRLDEKQSERDLHYSHAISTSRSHITKIRKALLQTIEETQRELEAEDSEEVALLVMDFFPI